MNVTKQTTINGKTFTIVPLGALQGLRMSRQLSEKLFPLLPHVFGESGKIDFMALTRDGLSVVTDLDIEAIAQELLQGATVDDFPLNIDKYFSANYGEFVQCMAFALKANFESFFKDGFFSVLN